MDPVELPDRGREVPSQDSRHAGALERGIAQMTLNDMFAIIVGALHYRWA